MRRNAVLVDAASQATVERSFLEDSTPRRQP